MTSLMSILAGPASERLGATVADALAVRPLAYEFVRFPDGEAAVNLRESVRGRDVYLLQATSPPVHDHLFELLLLADACRRAGAARLTAVIPYFGYARQERRANRQSLGARVAADLVSVAHFDRLMLIDAHTPSIEAFFDVPIDHLTAVPTLAVAAKRWLSETSVVVAPDLGAVKRARQYARLLQVPMAIVHKSRLSGTEVEAHGVIGDVRERTPLIVDDVLSTGATIEAAVGALRQAGTLEPAVVIVTHALFVGDAWDRLRRMSIARVIATDTVPIDDLGNERLDVATVTPLIAAAIRRHHFDESLADLRVPA